MNSDKQVKVGNGSALSYHNMVETLVKKFPRFAFFKKGKDIDQAIVEAAFDDMATKLEFMHLAIGLATEAAEAADVIKAHAIYGKEFDRAALVKELGDLRFWIQDAQNKFHISDHEIAQGNADKLAERYKKTVYSDAQAIARVDKKYCVAGSLDAARAGLYIAGPFEHKYEAERVANPTEFIVDVGGKIVYAYSSYIDQWAVNGSL